MSSTEFVISKGASSDISDLATGKARADVALRALKEEDLTQAQIEVLTALARKFEEKVSSGIAEGSSVSSNEGIQTLITQAGGIFIGKDELVKLGKLSADAQIPEIPAEYNQAFLEAAHPLRDGTIASHCILAFDPESNKWHCIDRGEGGVSDIVPGSLGTDGRGLSGDKQDKLLQKQGKQITVGENEISSPKDSYPIERILDNAIAMHLADGKPIKTAPFREIWGRTADTARARVGCRILLGNSHEDGSDVRGRVYHSDDASNSVGLFACWNKKT